MARDTLFLSAISGLVLVVIAWISLPALYKAVSLPENMMGDALLYGRVYLFALPIIYIYDVGRAILISPMSGPKSPSISWQLPAS